MNFLVESGRTFTCKRHPSARAGWSCQGCRADLCPDCTATRKVGVTSATMYVCCLCGDLAYAITQHRSATPFSVRILQAPRYPLTTSGLIALVALGGFIALLSYRGFFPILSLIVALIS